MYVCICMYIFIAVYKTQMCTVVSSHFKFGNWTPNSSRQQILREGLLESHAGILEAKKLKVGWTPRSFDNTKSIPGSPQKPSLNVNKRKTYKDMRFPMVSGWRLVQGTMKGRVCGHSIQSQFWWHQLRVGTRQLHERANQPKTSQRVQGKNHPVKQPWKISQQVFEVSIHQSSISGSRRSVLNSCLSLLSQTAWSFEAGDHRKSTGKAVVCPSEYWQDLWHTSNDHQRNLKFTIYYIIIVISLLINNIGPEFRFNTFSGMSLPIGKLLASPPINQPNCSGSQKATVVFVQILFQWLRKDWCWTDVPFPISPSLQIWGTTFFWERLGQGEVDELGESFTF